MSISVLPSSALRDLANRIASPLNPPYYEQGFWWDADALPDARVVQAVMAILCVADFGKIPVTTSSLTDGPLNNPLFLQGSSVREDAGRYCSYMDEGINVLVSVDAGGGPLEEVCVYSDENRGYAGALWALRKTGILDLLADPTVTFATVAEALVSKTNLGQALGLDAAGLASALEACSYEVASALGDATGVEGGEGPVVDLDEEPPTGEEQPLFGNEGEGETASGEQGSTAAPGEEGSSGGGRGWIWGLGLVAAAAVGVAFWAPWEGASSDGG